MDEEGPVKRLGFAYDTLPEHAESGEERFAVEWHEQDDTVWYDILAFSRPQQTEAGRCDEAQSFAAEPVPSLFCPWNERCCPHITRLDDVVEYLSGLEPGRLQDTSLPSP